MRSFAPTAVAVAAAAACAGAVAQVVPAPADAPTSLETVTITSTRRATAVADIPASISVVDGVKLERALAVSSESWDALNKFVPGLEVNSETSFSNDGKGPLLRGRSASVLFNGVPVNSLLRGNGFVLGQMDSNAIDRIEVNRGATAAFGFGAPGGLISVQTRRGESASPEITFRSSISANTTAFSESLSPRMYVGVGQKKGDTDYHVGVGIARDKPKFDYAGNPTFSQDVSSVNVDGTFGLKIPNGRLEFSANLFDRRFRANYEPGAYYRGYCIGNDFDTCPLGGAPLLQAIRLDDPLSAAQYQRNNIAMAKLTQEWGRHSFDGVVYAMHKKFQLGTIYSDLADPPTIGGTYDVNTNTRYGLRAGVTTRFGEGQEAPSLTYGVDLQRDRLSRPAWDSSDIATVPPAPSRPVSPPAQLDSHALFLQGKSSHGPWVFTGGARVERFQPRSLGYTVGSRTWPDADMPDFGATSYNAGVVHKFSRDTEGFVSVSQGLEVGELGRLLRDAGRNPGVVDVNRIRPEPVKTTQYELGLRSRSGGLNTSAAIYYVDAPLAALLDCSTSVTQPCVVRRQPEKTWGVELTADWRINSQWTLGGNLTWQDGTYEDATGNEYRQTNVRLTPPRLVAYGSWRPAPGWEANLTVNHVFSRKPFADVPAAPFGLFGPNGAFVGNVSGYTTFDLSGSVAVGPGTLSVGIENLFNKRYIPSSQQGFGDLFYMTYGEGRRLAVSYNTSF